MKRFVQKAMIAGYDEGGSAEPTTPTDNRTSLKYWYSYLQDNWYTQADWENYTEIEYGEPLEEIAYPTGTQNVTEVEQFLCICTYYEDLAGGYGQRLQGLPVTKMTGVLDLPNVTNASALLNYGGHLEDAGTIAFHKPLTDVSHMFSGCYNLKKVTLTGFDTSECVSFSRMFLSCYKLETLPISFDTSNGTDVSYMFYGCQKLVSIPSLDLSSADNTKTSYMFDGCSNLEHIGITGTIGVSLDLKNCSKLSHDTLVAILNALVPKTSGTWKLTIGSTNIAKLTQEELDIATTKGWQVV